ERDHDLRPGAGDLLGGVRDRAYLHGEQAGDDQAEPYTAQAEHRVLLLQPLDGGQQVAVLVGGLAGGDLDGQADDVGQELVERREDAHAVGLLQRFERVQRGLALLRGGGEHQVLDELAAVAEEHVLGPAQPDALGAEPDRPGGVLGVVGVGPHAQPALGVGVPHDAVDGLDQLVLGLGALEVLDHGGVDHRHLAEVDLAAGAVDGDDVALADDHAARGGEGAPGRVDVQLLGAAHAGLAHASGDHGGVRGLAAAAGEDAAGGDHAGQVVGVGLAAHQDDVLALGGQLDGPLGGEDDLADGRAGRGVHALGDAPLAAAAVEAGEHELSELVAGHPGDGLVHGDEALVDELGGDAEGGRGGALADPGLQHPELAALDGELDVTQVAVV